MGSRPGASRLPALPTLLTVLLLLLGAGVPAWVAQGDPAADPQPRCALGAHLVPRCGALLGITPSAPSEDSLTSAEEAVGRRFDLVYSFHDINDTIPSAYDEAVVGSGALLHVTIDSRDYASPDRSTVPWSAVAAGQYDELLTRQARGIASLGVPVFVTFDHEADQPSKSALGTPADFVAAWRHVHDVFERAGATNAVWVWVMLGWAPSFPTAARMWPGNDDVDWISWDAYDDAGCRTGVTAQTREESFAQVALPFLTWLHRDGATAGIDVHKPLMISETGTMSVDRAAWFRGMLDTLRQHPAIRAVTLWDHTGSSGGCDYTFTGQPDVARAVGAIAGDPWLDPLGPDERGPDE